MTLGHADVVAAAERLRGLVRRTPTLRLDELEDGVRHTSLWAKCENLQHIGAFKARGALHATSRLPDAVRQRGLITYSSGNHAQAVALAARHFGVRADIAMPEDAPAVKTEAVRRLGARIHVAGTTSPERKQRAAELQRELGGTIIEPFDDPDIVCGQGTATLELLADARAAGVSLDTLVVPVGGGGLVAGACLACEGRDIDIVTVEPVGCDAMRQSLAAGERVDVTPGPTVADGLKPTRVGDLNFDIARQRVAASVTVDDAEIVTAMTALLTRSHVLVEPSGAAALAAILAGKIEGDHVAVILSGGNVAPGLVRRALAGEPA